MSIMKRLFGSREASGRSRDRIDLQSSEDVIYAIGDVHGRLDLLVEIEKAIERDAGRLNTGYETILLGDVVDRGPSSAQVIDFLLGRQSRGSALICLLGNHEQSMLEFVRAPSMRAPWLKQGGTETLESYGLRLEPTMSPRKISEAIGAHVPDEHIRFLEGLPIAVETDRYFFSHAGVRPGVSLDKQTEHDLIWFKDQMASDFLEFPKLVVHGHDALPMPSIGSRRINIDTGAYATGLLTAVRLAPMSPPFTLFTQALVKPSPL